MANLKSYGPSLVVLGTAAIILLGGPFAIRNLTYVHTQRKVELTRRALDGSVLEQINQTYRDIATVVEPSVVHISSEQRLRDGFGAERSGSSSGSGWVYDDQGHIVTNFHVIRDARRVQVQLYDGTLREAEVVGSDPFTDIAVIKIAAGRLHPAQRASQQPGGYDVQQGDIVFAFGSPFDFRFSMSTGVVSGTDRYAGVISPAGSWDGYENFIQVDAAINPGNSGGPLTDVHGHVIGMNTAIATGRNNSLDEGQFAGIGLAIPLDMIDPVVEQLIDRGYVVKGFLGVGTDEIRDDRLASQGFTGRGVLISTIDEDGPAQRAGVRTADIVTAVNGTPVSTVAQLRSEVSSIMPGEIVELKLWRRNGNGDGGGDLTIEVELARLDSVRIAGMLPGDQPTDELRPLGIARMANSTSRLARQYGVRHRPGILVEQVIRGSRLSRDGVGAGWIIVGVGNTSVETAEQLIEELRKYDLRKNLRGGGGVSLTFAPPKGPPKPLHLFAEP